MTEIYDEEKRIHDAFETAVKYIAVSPRSEKEVKEKLYKKGFHKNEVEGALEKAKGYHYIDDENYVKSFLDYYQNKYGKVKLAYKLTFEKGINKTLVENLIDDVLSDELECEKAESFATKYVNQKKITKKDAQKVGSFLYQKGFEWRIINKVVSSIFENLDFYND